MSMNSQLSEEKPVRLRQRLRQATAEAILTAAEQVFALDGHGARMESIASRAGISVGTLYNHFTNREGLWNELCRSRREMLLVRLDEALERSRCMPFDASLRALLSAFVAHWNAHRGFMSVLMQFEPLGFHSSGPRSSDRTLLQEMCARVEEVVRRGVAEGALDPAGASVYPSLLLGTLRSVLLLRLEASPPPEAGPAVERVVHVFLHGAGKPL
jgi:AcrR family transcriptional regulator